jgi:two-component system chemotaxis response regulator CheB
VRVARQNERLLPGYVYLAPDDHHLTLRAPGTIGLQPPAGGDRFCPSANLLFDSIAKTYGPNAIGLVLTGMGDDGTRGLLALRAAGAPTLAQDAASCVVYGMPRAAIEAGAITHTEPLATMAEVVLGLVAGVVPHAERVMRDA